MKKKIQNQSRRFSPLTLLAIILCVICIIFGGFTIVFFVMLHLVKTDPVQRLTPSPVRFSYFTKRPDLLSSSKALVVYDSNTQVPILTKNQNLRFSPASTAKMMSAVIALEHFNPDTVLTVDYFPQQADSSRMGLFLGEKMSVLNLVYGMLLPSGSDAADVLAQNYPGGEKGFVEAMNAKAKQLGLQNTHFVDPSGYSDDNYSTAYDLVRLGKYALTNPTIALIVKTKSTIVYNQQKTIPHILKNLNELLEIPGVTGIKTGFTNEAEGVLVTSFSYNDHDYVLAVLGSKDRFSDTIDLIEGIIKDLKSTTF